VEDDRSEARSAKSGPTVSAPAPARTLLRKARRGSANGEKSEETLLNAAFFIVFL
jgi:hypothetical protein